MRHTLRTSAAEYVSQRVRVVPNVTKIIDGAYLRGGLRATVCVHAKGVRVAVMLLSNFLLLNSEHVDYSKISLAIKSI
jgi:hypothetical protein